MIFEVELFDFEGEDISKDKDKSIIKRIKVNGEGYDHPNVRIIILEKKQSLFTLHSIIYINCFFRMEGQLQLF